MPPGFHSYPAGGLTLICAVVPNVEIEMLRYCRMPLRDKRLRPPAAISGSQILVALNENVRAAAKIRDCLWAKPQALFCVATPARESVSLK